MGEALVVKKPMPLLLTGAVLLFALPIFRSGLRENMTLWEFIKNHTIYGPPVEYVPAEKYEEEFM